MKINHYFKLALFLLLFVFLGCQEDSINTIESLDNKEVFKTNHESHSDFERVALSQLEGNQLFSKLSTKFKANKFFDVSLKTVSTNKTTPIVIVTDTISVIEKQSYTSYTLLVKTSDQKPNQTKNLVLEDNNGIQEAFILTYTFEDDWLLARSNGSDILPKGTVSLEKFDVSGISSKGASTARERCGWVTITVPAPCGCGHYSLRDCKGCNYSPRWPTTSTSSLYICENTGGGNGGTDLYATEETDLIITGGWPTPNDNNDYSQTVMMLEDTSEMVIYAMIVQMNTMLNNTLTQNEKDYLKANPFEAVELNNFLLANDTLEGREIINKAISSLFNLDRLKVEFEMPNFDPINTPWLDRLRDAAKKIAELINNPKTPAFVKILLITNLDNNLSIALTATALNYNINAFRSDETQKQQTFNQSGREGVGILLYEFANGKGPDTRDFNYSGDMVAKMFEGQVAEDLKADFFNLLQIKNWSFGQFVNEGVMPSGYGFSPGHTTFSDSFAKHIRANDVQFFVGGANIKYLRSSESGYVIVELTNPTSRNSLLLHIGDNYERDGSNSGNNRPLSTIIQTFRFKLKINRL